LLNPPWADGRFGLGHQVAAKNPQNKKARASMTGGVFVFWRG